MSKSTSVKIGISNTILEHVRFAYANTSGITSAPDSEVIINTLLYFSLLSNSPKSYLDKNGLDSVSLLVSSCNERTNTKCKDTTNIRIPNGLLKYIKEISGNRSYSETIEQMLACVIREFSDYNNPQTARFNVKSKQLLKLTGSKWDKRMQEGINDAITARSWERSYELCCGALGIHANFKCAEEEHIYDIDKDKVNLYRVIKEKPATLISELLSHEVNETEFDNIKNMRNEKKKIKIPDVTAAAYFLYCNLNSSRWGDEEFNPKAAEKKYMKKLAQIHLLHRRLQNVTITKKDLFKSLNSIDTQNNSLLIIDPPYLDTSAYKDNIISYEEHKKLRNLILKKQKEGADFIYFCRITAGHKGKATEKEKLKKIEEECIIMERKIDNLYANQNFFYRDIQLDKGIIERIITSFDYPEATPYTRE